MEATALCVRLLLDVLVLLVAQVNLSYFAQEAGAAFPRVLPDRLQFFEYESVTVDCERFGGVTEWRVMRKLNEISPEDSSSWNSSAPSCTIDPAFKGHSGEYWCEDGEGNTSRAVSIAVTAGSVILDVPARPVVEGHDVVLHCIKKDAQSRHIADFYKGGSKLGTRYEDNMIIQNVSRSDEGFYKCSISGAGESPESWLTVSNLTAEEEEEEEEETRPFHSGSSNRLSPLWIVVSVLSVVLLLLVVVMVGVFLCRKHKGSVCSSSGTPTTASHSAEDHTGGDNAGDPGLVTYAAVRRPKKKKDSSMSRAGTRPDEGAVYSVIHYRPLALD